LTSFEPRAGYRVIWVARLPQIDLPLEAPECMVPGISWAERVIRQAIPRRQVRDCCSYHAADWHAASKAAIRIARQAYRGDPDEEELGDRVLDLAAAAGLSELEQQAAESLAYPGCGIDIGRAAGERHLSYMDGRHRARAMMDAGVRRTVIAHWIWPDD
jgi:hypothetical protein